MSSSIASLCFEFAGTHDIITIVAAAVVQCTMDGHILNVLVHVC